MFLSEFDVADDVFEDFVCSGGYDLFVLSDTLFPLPSRRRRQSLVTRTLAKGRSWLEWSEKRAIRKSARVVTSLERGLVTVRRETKSAE